jgi:hypothetical protein
MPPLAAPAFPLSDFALSAFPKLWFCNYVAPAALGLGRAATG